MPHVTPRLSCHRRELSADKSHRTAGMIARADPPLQRMPAPFTLRLMLRFLPRLMRAARRLGRGLAAR